MRAHKAFSLIELLVVIAIVGVLVVVAIPAYKVYRIRSRIAGSLPTIDSLIQQMIVYTDIHGNFPSPEDLKYAGSGAEATNPGEFNALFSYISFDDSPSIFNCPGARGLINIVYDASAIGIDAGATFSITCFILHTGDSWSKLCGTVSSDANYSNLVPGMSSYVIAPYTYNQDFLDKYSELTLRVTCP